MSPLPSPEEFDDASGEPPVTPPTPDQLERAAHLIRQGRLVAFPTETVYGLGADATNPQAVASIFRAKGRPLSNPLIVHVCDQTDARSLTTTWPELAQALADRFWPGPLTLVLPRSSRVPDVVAGGPAMSTVGLRAPAHPVARALLEACGVPLAAPSANRSEGLSPTRAEHVARAGLKGVTLILDGGPCVQGIESTVLDLSGPRPRLLRPGALDPATLRQVVPELELPDAAAPLVGSPGLAPRHYAPRAALRVAVDPANWRGEIAEAERLGVIHRVSSQDFQGNHPAHAVRIALPDDPAGFAAGLYAALHDLDRAGVTQIVVEAPPATEEWLAVRDRLRRASCPPGGSGV